MYPAQCNQLHLVLDIKDLLFVHRVAAVRSALLLRDDNVCDVQLVLRQITGQNSARLDVFRGVGVRQLQEHIHRIPRHMDEAQGARQQGIRAVISRLLITVEAGLGTKKKSIC